MAKVTLSKTALQKERESLRLYRRILPSLDLKRLQLMGELARARSHVASAREAVRQTGRLVAEQFPMLANPAVTLSHLVDVTAVNVATENVVGVKLPRFESLEVSVTPYALMSTPAWLDALVEQLQKMLHLRAAVRVSKSRVALLNRAVRRVTQRINLFEKILIPRAEENIKRIKIFLSDMERSSIVRAKLAKAKRLEALQALRAREAGP